MTQKFVRYSPDVEQEEPGFRADPSDGSGRDENHLAKFQQELIKIEEGINERNKTRTPYEFLLPSKIPQSINI